MSGWMLGDWLQLGIEPTRDVALIRRAYALKLRKTRPDDDAEAYQQLRSAYDRLLAAARAAPLTDDSALDGAEGESAPALDPALMSALANFRLAGDGGGGGVVVAPLPDVVGRQSTLGQDDEAPDAERESARRTRERRESREARQSHRAEESRRLSECDEGRQSDQSRETRQSLRGPDSAEPAEASSMAMSTDSVESLAAEWRATAGGAEGMALAWAGIALRLDRLPLASHEMASRLFADVVIATPGLPVSCLAQLRAYFDWRGDFRAEQLLGVERAAALNDVLDKVAPRPITDSQILRTYRHLLLLNQLLTRRDYLRAALLSALVGTPMSRLAADAEPMLLLRLGGDVCRAVRKMSAIGTVLRLMAWIAAVALVGVCYGADGTAVGRGLSAAMLFVSAYFVLRVLVGWVHSMLQAARRGRMSGWLTGAVPIVGFVLIAIGTLLSAIMSIDAYVPPGFVSISIGLVLCGTLLAWPAERDDATLSMLGALGMGLMGWPTVGLVWCLLAARLVQRVSVGDVISRAEAGALPAWAWFVGFFFALPILGMLTARRMGMSIVLAALAVPVALRQMHFSPRVTTYSALVIATVVLIALVLLQLGSIYLVDAWEVRQRGRD